MAVMGAVEVTMAKVLKFETKKERIEKMVKKVMDGFTEEELEAIRLELNLDLGVDDEGDTI